MAINCPNKPGGTLSDVGLGIAVDSSGNAYVTGTTASADFPTTAGAFQTARPGYTNGFITKLNAAGTAPVYSTYLGGALGSGPAGVALTTPAGIAIDTFGNAYATGDTNSKDFPTTAGAFQTALQGAVNAFATKLDPTGTSLIYSTYLGETLIISAGPSLLIRAAMLTLRARRVRTFPPHLVPFRLLPVEGMPSSPS